MLLGSAGSRIAHNALDRNGNNGAEVNGASDATSSSRTRANGNAHRHRGGLRPSRARRRQHRAKNETAFLFFDLHDSLISANRARGEDGLVLSGGQFGSDGNRLAGNVANGNHGPGSSSRTTRPPR